MVDVSVPGGDVAAGPGRHGGELRHQPPGGGARPQERVEVQTAPLEVRDGADSSSLHR